MKWTTPAWCLLHGVKSSRRKSDGYLILTFYTPVVHHRRRRRGPLAGRTGETGAERSTHDNTN